MKFTANGHEYEVYFDMSTLSNYTGQFNEYLVDLNIFQDDLKQCADKAGSIIIREGDSYYMVPPLAINKNEKFPEKDVFDSTFYSYVPSGYIVLLPGCCGGSKHMKDDQSPAFSCADLSSRAVVLRVSDLSVGQTIEVNVLDRDPWDHPLPCNTEFNFVTFKLKYKGNNEFQVWRHEKTSPPDSYHRLLPGNCFSVGHMTYWSNDSWKKNSSRIGYGSLNKTPIPVPVDSYFFLPSVCESIGKKVVRKPPHLQEMRCFMDNFNGLDTLVLPLKGHTLDPQTAVTAQIDAGLSAFASITNPVALITGNGLVRTAKKNWSNQAEVDFYKDYARKDVNNFKLPLLDTVQTYERDVNDYFSGDKRKETATYMPCFALTGFNAGTTTSFCKINRTILVVPDFLMFEDVEKRDMEKWEAAEYLAAGLHFSGKSHFKIVCGVESASATIEYPTSAFAESKRVAAVCKKVEERFKRLGEFATKSTLTEMRKLFASFFLQIFMSKLYTAVAFGVCKYVIFDSTKVREALKADFLKNKSKYEYSVDGVHVEKGGSQVKFDPNMRILDAGKPKLHEVTQTSFQWRKL